MMERTYGRRLGRGLAACAAVFAAACLAAGLVASLLPAPARAAAGATAGYADKSLGIEGFAQMRWQLDHKGAKGTAAADNQNYFRLRRLRLRATGDWNRYFRVRLQLALQELAKDEVSGEILEDAFIRIKKSEAIEIDFGQYKLPISREELRTGTAERQQAEVAEGLKHDESDGGSNADRPGPARRGAT